MLQEQVRSAENEKDNLGKQNNKLLVSKNPQAKTQYLENLRSELNTQRKENIKLQEENRVLRRKDEQNGEVTHRLLSTGVRQFCNNICRVLEVPTVAFEAEAKGSAVKSPEG